MGGLAQGCPAVGGVRVKLLSGAELRESWLLGIVFVKWCRVVGLRLNLGFGKAAIGVRKYNGQTGSSTKGRAR